MFTDVVTCHYEGSSKTLSYCDKVSYSGVELLSIYHTVAVLCRRK